jgi:hypothetical protein
VSLASIQPGFRAAEAHVERASRVCARAFHDSPLWQYYIPQDRKRREKLHHIFAVLIRYGIRYGEVYATSPELEGIAVWVPSSRYPMSTLAQIRCGGLGVIPAVGFRSTLRLVRVNAFLESTHENVASGPHWYLAPIAVEPRHQGRGYAVFCCNRCSIAWIENLCLAIWKRTMWTMCHSISTTDSRWNERLSSRAQISACGICGETRRKPGNS